MFNGVRCFIAPLCLTQYGGGTARIRVASPSNHGRGETGLWWGDVSCRQTEMQPPLNSRILVEVFGRLVSILNASALPQSPYPPPEPSTFPLPMLPIHAILCRSPQVPKAQDPKAHYGSWGSWGGTPSIQQDGSGPFAVTRDPNDG